MTDLTKILSLFEGLNKLEIAALLRGLADQLDPPSSYVGKYRLWSLNGHGQKDQMVGTGYDLEQMKTAAENHFANEVSLLGIHLKKQYQSEFYNANLKPEQREFIRSITGHAKVTKGRADIDWNHGH